MDTEKPLSIVLNMIVRNEEHTILRCFRSICDYVDHIVVCDTGSTDNTCDVIESYANDAQTVSLPITLYRDEWKHFGHNRTLAFSHVRETIPKEEWSRTWVLFLDADMVCHIQHTPHQEWRTWVQRTLPLQDAWYVTQKTNHLEYQNLRWVRLDVSLVCQCPTHEYYELPNDSSKGFLSCQDMWIEDRQDGGCKQDKFQRDIRLLTEYLETHPWHARCWFYLANSFRDADQPMAAIQTYEKRIKLQGWNEEIYLSWVYMGDCYKKIPDTPVATLVHTYLQAIDVCPQRLEAYYRLAHVYRNQKKYHLAWHFCQSLQHLVSLDDPTPLPLFLESSIRKYLLDVEMAIVSFYVNEKEQGRQALNRLRDTSAPIPLSIRQWAEHNAQQFYTTKK